MMSTSCEMRFQGEKVEDIGIAMFAFDEDGDDDHIHIHQRIEDVESLRERLASESLDEIVVDLTPNERLLDIKGFRQGMKIKQFLYPMGRIISIKVAYKVDLETDSDKEAADKAILKLTLGACKICQQSVDDHTPEQLTRCIKTLHGKGDKQQ